MDTLKEEKKAAKIKRRANRPAKFSNPDELQTLIDEYFKQHNNYIVMKDDEGNIVKDSKGNVVTDFKPPTISGLALFLGFLSRQSIYDYTTKNDDDELSYLIKRAVTKIEEFAESQLFSNKPVGSIFWLKNHRWTDKQEIEMTKPLEIVLSDYRGAKKEGKDDQKEGKTGKAAK
jgi:hypothetical protein